MPDENNVLVSQECLPFTIQSIFRNWFDFIPGRLEPETEPSRRNKTQRGEVDHDTNYLKCGKHMVFNPNKQKGQK